MPRSGQCKESWWQLYGPQLKRQGHSVGLSLCMHVRVRLRACVAACMPFCHPGGERATLFLFINLSESPIPKGRSMFLSVYLFVRPGIPCPGLSQTFFPLCLKYDLFRKTILTILIMRSVDHAFCEGLYLCDLIGNLYSQGM